MSKIDAKYLCLSWKLPPTRCILAALFVPVTGSGHGLCQFIHGKAGDKPLGIRGTMDENLFPKFKKWMVSNLHLTDLVSLL